MTAYDELQQHSAVVRSLSALIDQVLAERGYVRIETDIVQPAELFLTRAGDQLIERLFTFENHGEISALRPEFTAAAARRYADHLSLSDGAPVARWQFHGPIFERTEGSGAIQQSFSVGAELIGDSSREADADVIVSALTCLRSAGVPAPSLILGSVALMRSLLKQFQLDSRTVRFLLGKMDDFSDPQRGRTFVSAALDQFFGAVRADLSAVDAREIIRYGLSERSQTLGGRTLDEIAQRLEQKRTRAAQRAHYQAAIDFLDRWASIRADVDSGLAQIEALIPAADAESQAEFQALCATIELLSAAGIDQSTIIVQPGLERSWDYYTGIVFELRADDRQVGGGGRYDELVRLLGAPVDVPAVGFALYADIVASLMSGAASE